MNDTDGDITTSLRQRVRASGISQDRLAKSLGMDRSRLSRILSGLARLPDCFAERVYRALDALETADVAADEARRRVLDRAGLSS